jgi:hypothetical protein
LFIYHHADGVAYLLLYVDDIVLTASSPQLLQRIITSLQQEFAMKDQCQLHVMDTFFGKQFQRKGKKAQPAASTS